MAEGPDLVFQQEHPAQQVRFVPSPEAGVGVYRVNVLCRKWNTFYAEKRLSQSSETRGL